MRDEKKENANNVIITLLVESPSNPLVNQKTDPTNKTNPYTPQISSKNMQQPPIKMRRATHGYNRRAELLAYARELREGETGQVQNGTKKNSRPNSKKWKWALRVFAGSRGSSFLGVFRPTNKQWSYERILLEKVAGKKKPFSPGSSHSSGFCRNFKKLMKQLSCRFKCYKG